MLIKEGIIAFKYLKDFDQQSRSYHKLTKSSASEYHSSLRVHGKSRNL